MLNQVVTVGDKAYSVVGFLYVQSRILKMFMFVFLLQEIMTEKIEFFFPCICYFDFRSYIIFLHMAIRNRNRLYDNP